MSGDAKEIIAIARDTRTHLSTLELTLSSDIEAIEQDAFAANRPMTKAETTRHDQLRAMLAETRDAFVALGFVTLQALNNSDTVKRLRADIADANQQIQADLARLKKIAKFAEVTARILEGLAKLTGTLAGFVA
ncbi:MAG TPA: hypothetical protein VJR58_21950 [Vineibacter sp.]|nr:hypothetical protein [Vineibacter sp.]